MGEGFDRIRPPRAGGRDPGPGDAGTRGRPPLFSRGGAGAPGGLLGLTLHCSRCGRSTALDPGVALRAALPVFLVLPWRDHPVFALCPACDRRSWLRLGAGGGRRP